MELLVGTKKGLITLRGERGQPLEVAGRAFAGVPVEYAIKDSRSGRYLAAVANPFYGPHLFVADDPTGDWEQVDGPTFPADTEAALERVWIIKEGVEDGRLWAGVDPAALFTSADGGLTWELNRGLWDEPSRPSWNPGGGGLALHSICPWPDDPQRLTVGISAAGVWVSEDAGSSWRRSNKGIVPRYLPEEAQGEAVDLCIHNLHQAPLRPERFWLQFHGGVYRSDDAGSSWTDIGSGLVSDFGFPLVADPKDPDRAFVIPLAADMDRVTPGGQVAVYETADAGETWIKCSEGLPQSAYLTVLRQAFDHDGGEPLGLYFGATSGAVFGSADGGHSWATVAEHLPPVYSVRVA